MNQYIKYFGQNYHSFIILGYLGIITIISAVLSTPTVDSKIIPGIALGFIIIFFSFSFLSKVFFKNELRVIDPSPFFKIYDVIVLILFLLCFASIGISIVSNLNYFNHGFSYPLRLISTAFHPLIPLESRLFHTLAPFSIVAPWGNEKLKNINFVLLIVLVFLMQVKIGALYLLIISILFFFEKRKSLPKKTLLTMSTVILSFTLFLTFFTSRQSWEDYKNLEEAQLIKYEKINRQEKFGKLNNCGDKGDPLIDKARAFFSDTPFNYYTFYRVVIQPSELSRLYVCAWENGFQGFFQGHQVARIFGFYKPLYNILYTVYYPNFTGNKNAHAVGNFLYDSYFQLGAVGVVLSSFILSFLFIFILYLDQLSSGLGHLMRINLIYGTLTASLLSTVIFFVPAAALMLWSHFQKTKGLPCVE